MLAAQRSTPGKTRNARSLATLLMMLAILATLVVFSSRDQVGVDPDAHYTNASPTAQLFWGG